MPTSDNVVKINAQDLSPEGMHERADELADKLLDLPQAEMPVIHRFSHGLYIREVKMPAGAMVLGHVHKEEHFNIMLQGRLAMINDDGTTTDYIAPQSFVAPPGRKIACIIEDTVWQNIFPIADYERDDIDALERRLFVRSDEQELREIKDRASGWASHEADRLSFAAASKQLGMSERLIRALSEREDDVIDMPEGASLPFRITESPIDGLGFFLTAGAKAGTVLAAAIYDNKRTPAGRYTNHSETPNAAYRALPSGDICLIALQDIAGCKGGDKGTELTTNYLDNIAVLQQVLAQGGKNSEDTLCRQQ